MTQHEFYQELAKHTGDDLETIESLGFELETFHNALERKERKRYRSMKISRQNKRERRLANIASRIQLES